MEYLPTVFKFGYGVLLGALCIAYVVLFPGPIDTSPYPTAEGPPLPGFVPSLAISAIVMIVAAALAEFVPNRIGAVLALLGALLGIGCVLLFLLPPLLAAPDPPMPAFRIPRIEDMLPWAMTTASVFVAMLPRRVSKERT